MWYENRSELYLFLDWLEGSGFFTQSDEPIRIVEKPWKWEGEYTAYVMDRDGELNEDESVALSSYLSDGLYIECTDKDEIRQILSNYSQEYFA
jgi:hypothetical protein